MNETMIEFLKIFGCVNGPLLIYTFYDNLKTDDVGLGIQVTTAIIISIVSALISLILTAIGFKYAVYILITIAGLISFCLLCYGIAKVISKLFKMKTKD